MEKFIEYNGSLLSRYEFSGGDMPSDKVLKARRKLADNGEVVIITSEDGFRTDQSDSKIIRKL